MRISYPKGRGRCGSWMQLTLDDLMTSAPSALAMPLPQSPSFAPSSSSHLPLLSVPAGGTVWSPAKLCGLAVRKDLEKGWKQEEGKIFPGYREKEALACLQAVFHSRLLVP